MAEKTPDIRFDSFAEDWKRSKIGDVITEKKRPVVLDDNTTYQLITVKRRNEGVVSRGFLKGKQILVKNYFELKAKDYVISKRQVVHGANGIVPEKLDGAIVSNEYLVAIENNDITSEFLMMISKLPDMYKKFFVSSYGIDIEKLVFDVDDWKKRELSIPTTDEQKKITAFYKDFDDLCSAEQQKYDKLVNFKKSMLDKMFPKDGAKVPEIRFDGFSGEWKLFRLGDITNSFSGGTPSVGIKEYYNGNIPFIRSAEIHSESAELYITDKGLTNSSAKLVNKGDILYALYGATSGEVGCAKIKGAINQAILAIVPLDGYNSEFMMYWLRNEKHSIISKYLQGGQGNLSGAIVKDLCIYTPKITEQTKIGNFFKNLGAQINLQKEKLQKLTNIKKAFLKKMFL